MPGYVVMRGPSMRERALGAGLCIAKQAACEGCGLQICKASAGPAADTPLSSASSNRGSHIHELLMHLVA